MENRCYISTEKNPPEQDDGDNQWNEQNKNDNKKDKKKKRIKKKPRQSKED